jgi:hypothetical protein
MSDVNVRPPKEEDRSLDPDEAYGAHKPRCTTRRAKLRRGRKTRVVSLGMTAGEKSGPTFC